MKSFLALPTLLSLVLAADTGLSISHQLDPSVPIYLGEVFWPPSMTFIAWLPTSMKHPLDWCSKATEASPNSLFSLSGVDSLQIHDYFGEHAHITREGKRFAECYITPESVRMGACEGVLDWDCEGGHRFTGPGTRKWTCWARQQERGRNGTDGRSMAANGLGDKLTDAAYRPSSVRTGAAASSSIMGAFTPGVTGS
jgi:hypothetical protein